MAPSGATYCCCSSAALPGSAFVPRAHFEVPQRRWPHARPLAPRAPWRPPRREEVEEERATRGAKTSGLSQEVVMLRFELAEARFRLSRHEGRKEEEEERARRLIDAGACSDTDSNHRLETLRAVQEITRAPLDV